MERRGRWLRPETLAWFTLAAVVAYVAIDVLLRFLRPHYSLIHNAESDYGRGPWYWVMDLNFLLRCLLSLAVAGALAHRIASKSGAQGGIALLVVWGVCSGLLALFADDVEGAPVTATGRVHLVLAFVAFTSIAVGAVWISEKVKSEATWGWVGPALLLISRLAVLAYLALGIVLGQTDGPDGLVERVFLGLELLWISLAAGYIATST